jgi:NHL repeat
MSIRSVSAFLVAMGVSLSCAAPSPGSLSVIGTFGTSGSGKLGGGASAIAVDPITGDVYVADTPNSRIFKYDQSGNFILMFGMDVNETTGGDVCTAASGDACKVGVRGSAPGQFYEPRGIAVDPVTEDVYVSDRGNERIERFTDLGVYKSEIVSGQNGVPAFTLTINPPFAESVGNDSWVDTEGNLYVSSLQEWEEGTVYKFNATGEYTGEVFALSGVKQWEYGPEAVVVDSIGTVYVSQHQNRGKGFVIKFSQAGTEIEKLTVGEGGQSAPEIGLAANLFTDEIFSAGWGPNGRSEGTVRVYDMAGKQVAEFASVHSEDPNAMAYGTSAGRLYELYGSEVVMYGTFPLPTPGPPKVSNEDWSTPGLSAITLSARVNPHSLDTKYYFQYATSPDLSGATNIPVPPGDAGSSFLPTRVSVDVTGLSQSTTYYYRLVAHNAYGGGAGTTVEGPIQSFTTLAPLPSAATEAASEIADNAATMHGTIVPGSTGAASETYWCFQYGTTDASAGVYDLGFAPGAPAGDVGQGTSATPVSVRLTRLQPGTKYRYRLVAVNSLGSRLPSTACGTEGGHETDGAEGTFTTGTAGPSPVAASGPPAEVSQAAATLTGTVNPQGTRTVYDFQLGTSTEYGVDQFGDAGSGTETEPVSIAVSSLQPATTYHYRLAASSRFGTSYGADMSFTTPSFPTSTLSAPLAPPLLAPVTIAFPDESKATTRTSKCKRGYKRDKRGRCVKAKPKKRAKGRGKGARTRR